MSGSFGRTAAGDELRLIRRRPHKSLLVVTAIAVAGLLTSNAPATPSTRASMEARSFTGIDESSALKGKLAPTTRHAYDGRRSARASVFAGNGNGYARAVRRISWRPGQTVTFGAAFYLPRGFRAKQQGAVALIRWDNWPTRGRRGDFGGLVLFESDGRLHLVRGRYDRGYEDDLVRGIRMAEGRWVHLEVRQRLSRSARALSEVYVDGRRVRRSSASNSYGRSLQRIRFGIVSISARSQVRPLTLYFDRATTGRVLSGPRG